MSITVSNPYSFNIQNNTSFNSDIQSSTLYVYKTQFTVTKYSAELFGTIEIANLDSVLSKYINTNCKIVAHLYFYNFKSYSNGQFSWYEDSLFNDLNDTSMDYTSDLIRDYNENKTMRLYVSNGYDGTDYYPILTPHYNIGNGNSHNIMYLNNKVTEDSHTITELSFSFDKVDFVLFGISNGDYKEILKETLSIVYV